MVATAPVAPAATVILSLIVILVAEAATAGAPTTGLAEESGAEVTAVAEATRTATSLALHVVASTPVKKSKNYDEKSPPRQATTTASPLSLHGFAIYFSWRNSNLWDHLVRREARSSTVAQMLRPLHRKRWWQ
jgi:phage-related protein